MQGVRVLLLQLLIAAESGRFLAVVLDDDDFKIRVGNYRNRLECIPDLHRIRKIYPASYAVKTEISLDELKRIPMQDIVTGTETAE